MPLPKRDGVNGRCVLIHKPDFDPEMLPCLWRDVLWAIWGKHSENGGSMVFKTAPAPLRERYEQMFHRRRAP